MVARCQSAAHDLELFGIDTDLEPQPQRAKDCRQRYIGQAFALVADLLCMTTSQARNIIDRAVCYAQLVDPIANCLH